MGHFLFIGLHLVAVLFLMWALVITIPLHLIYAAVSGRSAPPSEPAPSPKTHVRCPECAEFVLNEARKCKHCSCSLVPVSEQPQ